MQTSSIQTSIHSMQLAAIAQTLDSARQLLERISEDAYRNRSAPPYHASVGGHIRHVLDVFDALLRGIDTRQPNLADRRRDQTIETQPAAALQALERIDQELQELIHLPADLTLHVTDNAGLGPIEIPYTLTALLYQAQSHAIHHFACIGYILAHQNVCIEIDGFGYNPTSPR